MSGYQQYQQQQRPPSNYELKKGAPGFEEDDDL